MGFMLSFHQCIFEFFTLFIPKADIAPRHKAANNEYRRPEEQRHPKADPCENQKTINAAQCD